MRSLGFVVLAAGSLTAFVSAQTPTSPAKPVFENGQAQIVPAFQDESSWIRQTLWVETEFDSDGDGKRDRVFVDVTRPRQTETEGLKVPIVYESSPYFAGTSGPREFLWDVKQEVGAEPPARQHQPAIAFLPQKNTVTGKPDNGLAPTWVPRGFAVVHSEAPGTGLSQGCVTVGGAPEELAPKAVIDWLNGRAKGFKTIDGSEEVSAMSWSTGKVGMTGTSYNGTIPVAAATTGVAGLEAIIPVAPNTSYYHYYRTNGLVRHPGGWLGEDIDFLYDYINSGDPARRDTCNAMIRDGLYVKGRDRAHGDYNDFWAERDLLTKVKGIKAAVLMAHAFNDWNVVPEHSVRIAMAIKGQVPLQFYFHQGGHGGPPPLEMMNKWFTRYLYGVQNGVEQEPKSWIVREATAGAQGARGAQGAQGAQAGRGRGAMLPPTPYADYPNPAASPVVLFPHVTPAANGSGVGDLGYAAIAQHTIEKLIDDVQFSGAALATAAQSSNRLLYATAALTEPVHLSGFSRVTLTLASSKPAANLSVWLVQLPWTEGPIGTSNLITRGWADPQNAAALTSGGDYHSKAPGTPLTPGKMVKMTFDLEPDDQIIPAGKRIG
ncbi:MAG: Xaa-Pro dipeptidyl-peptidase, partial [Acidobacteria bacterium]|nr:Xaa-Pro dipeptidyl-peptidase [Acidobacteriota bacterium]